MTVSTILFFGWLNRQALQRSSVEAISICFPDQRGNPMIIGVLLAASVSPIEELVVLSNLMGLRT